MAVTAARVEGAAAVAKPPARPFHWGPEVTWGIILVIPYLVVFLAFVVWPVAYGLWLGASPAAFRTLFADPIYFESAWNTAVFLALGINIKLFLALLLSGFLAQARPWIRWLSVIFILPWAVPSIPTIFSFRWMLNSEWGMLNGLLWELFGIEGPWWLIEPHLAFGSVIFVHIWKYLPFWTLILLAGRMAIPTDLYEAATIDGARPLQKFAYVTWPQLKNLYITSTLLSTIWTFNNFETIYLLTGGGPGGATRVYSIMAYELAIRGLRFGPGTAVAFSLTPVLAFLILLLSRYMRRDVVAEELQVTWQDRVIDAVGWMVGWVSRVVTFPIALVAQALRSLLRSRGAQARPRSRQQARRWSALGRGIGMAVLLLFILFPLYWIVITAFKTELQIGQRTSIFWPRPWSTQQFHRLFYDEPFFVWFKNSLIVTISTTVLSVIFSSLGAYALARLRFRGAESMTTVLLVTYLLPGALMFIPLYRILTELHLINSLQGLIATYPTFMMPFATWLLMGYYRSIPEDLEHAAMVDGATRLQAFLRVTLPLTAPALLAVTLFSFTSAWKEFLFAFVFITSERLMTLPVGLAQTIYGDIYPWGLLMAASLLISLPVVIIYVYGQRFMIAGLTAGSVKG